MDGDSPLGYRSTGYDRINWELIDRLAVSPDGPTTSTTPNENVQTPIGSQARRDFSAPPSSPPRIVSRRPGETCSAVNQIQLVAQSTPWMPLGDARSIEDQVEVSLRAVEHFVAEAARAVRILEMQSGQHKAMWMQCINTWFKNGETIWNKFRHTMTTRRHQIKRYLFPAMDAAITGVEFWLTNYWHLWNPEHVQRAQQAYRNALATKLRMSRISFPF